MSDLTSAVEAEFPRLLFLDHHGNSYHEVPTELEQLAFEARGYRSHVIVELADGKKYSVIFYTVTRLASELKLGALEGDICLADAGMIVLLELTYENMKRAVRQLYAEKYFEELLPIQS